MAVSKTEVLIIGCSIAGLASAATMSKHNIPYIVIEKTDSVVKPWKNHYDRLHLHTSKNISNLPYKKFKSGIPKYPSRIQIVEYMESYQRSFDINPLLNTEATKISHDGRHWITETNNGTFESTYVIIATGPFGTPKEYKVSGLDTFSGSMIHSSQYKTGRVYKGQKVLVIGFGNSACEIAIDLHEQGATPFMSVRSGVNVLPKEVLGIPTLSFGIPMSKIPPRLIDKINAPLLRVLVGDITKLGLKKAEYGPMEQIEKNQKVPVLDIGTMKLIKDGHITIYDDIDHIEKNTVHFADGKKVEVDVIISAIGYNKGTLEGIIDIPKERFEDLNQAIGKQKFFGTNNLYFNGFWVSNTGQFREIRLDALKIVKDILKKRSS